ncbi:hypothetical protein PHMEG_0001659 [Phytophthora megakarya]|uniref:Uncharacterized protein n=1 Tax=Phytophthora megakarya TaxID=4795 RepID=A0A225X0P4_9STRA|nr:hypothetical protein PHMEG_0001659 [Phytophthora megakarya]
MIRKCGYSFRGTKLAVRIDFQRKPRVSTLAFLGVNGIIDFYSTEGTCDRIEFGEMLLVVKLGNIRVRILFTYWTVPPFTVTLKSFTFCGELALSRFFYRLTASFKIRSIQTFGRFEAYDMSRVFQYCGWQVKCRFNPIDQLEKENSSAPGMFQDIHEEEHKEVEDQTDELDFVTT